MSYWLLTLRALCITLSFFVVNDYDVIWKLFNFSVKRRLITPEAKLDSSNIDEINGMLWNAVDIFSPPPLKNPVSEALRLNELLSRKQYNCNESIKVGSDKWSFVICGQKMAECCEMKEALFISGYSENFVSYLTALNPERWIFFVPKEFQQYLDLLGDVDAEMHYLMELDKTGVWAVDSIVEELFDRKFDSTLINVYTLVSGNPSSLTSAEQSINAPKIVEAIVKSLNTSQLHILVEISPKNAADVIYSWYKFLFSMPIKYNYALVGAEADPACSRYTLRCIYLLSFVRSPIDEIELPPFGFGSPLEERMRLLKYLLEIKSNGVRCVRSQKTVNDIPLLCEFNKTMTDACNVIYIRYRELEVKEDFDSLKPCRILFFSPLPTMDRWLVAQSLYYRFGLSEDVGKNATFQNQLESESWQMITLSSMLQMTKSQKNVVLILDLDGGEWDVFPTILQTPEVQIVVHRIVIRLRLWIGEENENYRLFFAYFVRLEKLGYKKYASDYIDSTTVLIVFQLENLL